MSKSQKGYPFPNSKPFHEPKSARAARRLKEKQQKLAAKLEGQLSGLTEAMLKPTSAKGENDYTSE
jgi:hypothetical protein